MDPDVSMMKPRSSDVAAAAVFGPPVTEMMASTRSPP